MFSNFSALLKDLGDRHYYSSLEQELQGMKSVLDVGCGASSPLRKIKKTFTSTGYDIFKPSIETSKKKKIHDNYKIGSVANLLKSFKKNSYDAVVALDIIEHLPKKEGIKFLRDCEEVARKKIVLLTPNGYYNQEPYGNNPYQVHKSGWGVNDFSKRGYNVVGMRGLKHLRGEQASLKFKPWIFWGTVSTLSQLITFYIPRFAYQLLAIKAKPE